jgi:[acyl-carrier-protein] S-malonyltransferase
MVEDGASRFTEIGPGKVLQGLIQKIDKTVQVDGVS